MNTGKHKYRNKLGRIRASINRDSQRPLTSRDWVRIEELANDADAEIANHLAGVGKMVALDIADAERLIAIELAVMVAGLDPAAVANDDQSIKRIVDAARCAEPDINTCPRCGGPADNGFSRDVPPSPYLCTKCEPPGA